MNDQAPAAGEGTVALGAALEALTRSIPQLRVRSNVPGRDLTTFSIGGPIAAIVEPQSVAELRAVLTLLAGFPLPPKVLGAGSNLLIPDRGIPAVVIKLGREFKAVTPRGGNRYELQGGASLMTVSRQFAEAGLSGLEFAGGIPGTVGGAAVMNAGAHGGDFSQVVESVTCLLPDGVLVELPAQELSFSYRHAEVPAGAVVVAAVVNLVPSDPARCLALRQSNLDQRKRTQPLAAPSAGSVFRNPAQLSREGAHEESAGAILDRLHCKGLTEGGAEVSTLHANWIINPTRTATAGDVLTLIARMQERVKKAAGIVLTPELVQW